MREVIIAFDVGTTFSGVSYCITDVGSGLPNKIQGVNEFIGQPGGTGDSKVPSQLLYLGGDVKYTGAEVGVFEEDGSDEAENMRPHYKKIEWFKLQMHPESPPIPGETAVNTQLPRGLTATEVYSDFLKYLFNYTKEYIKDGVANGDKILSDESCFRFIITHPNGWELLQQQRLRKAAMMAGIISHENDYRLHLVTEGEAAIHFCINADQSQELLESEAGIMVIDAGGGTIDISAYKRCSGPEDPRLKLEEIVESQCLMHGSVFVNAKVKECLEEDFNDSNYERHIPTMLKLFESNGKRMFDSSPNLKKTYIQFGTSEDNSNEDRTFKFEIRAGRLGIPFQKMVSFFEPSISAILKTVNHMISHSTFSIKHILLVGGFAGSPWLKRRLKDAIDPQGICVTWPRGQLSKAAADGAVAYYLNQHVTTRVARLTYGTKNYTVYNPSDPEHKHRYKTHRFVDPADGKAYIDGLFTPIVKKGTQVHETREFRSTFFRKFRSFNDPLYENPLNDEIICYRGDNIRPQMFRDTEPTQYKTIFTLQSTLSDDALKWLEKRSHRGKKYFQIDYDIIFYFGLTEMKVQAIMTYTKPGVTPGTEDSRVERFEPKVIYFDKDDDSA